jgi:hypothetical protein
MVVDQVVTDASGRFSAVHSDAFEALQYAITVEKGDLRRTYFPRAGTTALEIRLGATREVRVTLSCAQPLEPDPPAPAWPTVTAYWLPDNDRWTTRTLMQAGRAIPMSPIVFHAEASEPPLEVPGGLRDFEVQLSLPVGEHRLAFDGPCGFDRRTIEISADEGPMSPIHVALPAAESGALELRFTGDPADRARPIHLFLDDLRVRTFWFEPGATARVEHLPRGTYRLRGYADSIRSACERRVEIRAGGTSTRVVRGDDCIVGVVPRAR